VNRISSIQSGNWSDSTTWTTSTIHELKLWPEHFSHVLDGSKSFEYRLNDRNYKVGDILFLQEYRPDTNSYTGRSLRKTVSYILFLENDYAILSLI
jgi:glyoxylate utilization-related uncharacterized protein